MANAERLNKRKKVLNSLVITAAACTVVTSSNAHSISANIANKIEMADDFVSTPKIYSIISREPEATNTYSRGGDFNAPKNTNTGEGWLWWPRTRPKP